MTYDDWKLATPQGYDDVYTCKHCGDSISDDKDFCSKSCLLAYDND